MKVYDKPRHEASQAVIELRKALGLSQAEFAVKVLGSAVTTMSRYETTHPPRKDQLLKFQQIAAEQGRSLLRSIEAKAVPDTQDNLNRVWKLAELAKTFNTLYLSELIDLIGTQFFVFRDWAGEGPHAFLLTKFKGLNGMRAAMSLMNIVSALESRSTKRKRTALEILTYVEKKQKDLIGTAGNIDDGGALIADAFKNDFDQLRNSLKEWD